MKLFVMLSIAVLLLTACDQKDPKPFPQSSSDFVPAEPGTIRYDTVTCTINDQLSWFHIGRTLTISQKTIESVSGATIYNVSQGGKFLTEVSAKGLNCVTGFQVLNDTSGVPIQPVPTAP